MAVAQLPDGRAQLFAAGIDTGHVYTCWKHTVDTTSPWTSWQSFAGTDIVALAIAPLADERLQLWGLDRHGALFSTWKLTVDANAGWSPWTPFPVP